jgi:hypothetical protein
MKIYRSLLIGLLALAIFICPLSIFGDDVEIHPAYITGKITLPGYNFSDVVSSAYVYANATGNFSASVQVQKDGTYTLTVNTPADGSKRDYKVYARVDLKSGCQFDAGLPVTISTVRGGTYTQNFSQELATLEVDGEFTNDDWIQLSPFYQSSTPQYLYFYMYVYKDRTHSFLIPANILFRWTWGYAYPKNSEKYTQLELEKKEFTASPGETVKLYWTGTFPEQPPVGAVSGSITYSPLPEGTLTRHYFSMSPVSTSITADGTYRLANVYAGTSQYFYAYSYFNNNRQYLYWPYSYTNPMNPNSPYITVPANGETVINLSATPCMVKGRLTLTGSKTLADTSDSVYVQATGVNKTSTYGGSASDSGVNRNTGEYTLYLTPGLWDVHASRGHYIYFRNTSSSNPSDYLYTYFNYYDYTKSSTFNNGLTVSAGQIVEGYDLEIPTGMVTIKYSSSDGALVSSPYIREA